MFTSGMATALYLNQHYAGKPVYLVGTQAFRRELLSYGIPLVEEGAEVVVAGFDTELVYEKLDKAVHFLRRGVVFIAANPDWVCPMPAGEVLPDCGSICALLTAASGRQADLHRQAEPQHGRRHLGADRRAERARSAAWATGCIPTLPWP